MQPVNSTPKVYVCDIRAGGYVITDPRGHANIDIYAVFRSEWELILYSVTYLFMAINVSRTT